MESVPQAHGETLLTLAPAAVNEIYPNETGASPQQWRTATRTGASPQQCPTGTHTHNSRSGNTGQGTQEQAPIYSTLYNAPVKPHKPRKGAGVYRGYTPNIKALYRVLQVAYIGHKRTPPNIGGVYVSIIHFQKLSQQHERENNQDHKPHFQTPFTQTRNAESIIRTNPQRNIITREIIDSTHFQNSFPIRQRA